MEISSEVNGPVQVEAMKKAIDVQKQEGREDLKVMESVNDQSKQMTAQKTGVGGNLNIMG